MAKYTKRLVVFLFLCLTNSLHLLTLSCSTSLQGSKDYAASRALQHEQGNAHEVHCSRERSRAAWKIIEEYLMPFVEKEHYQVSTGCRLHPDNDLYRDQEQHKIHEDGNEWRCGYCRKSFYEERYLNKHFDNRHYNLLNVSHSRCLADVCGALHCDFVMDSATRKTKCNPAAAARNKHLCESLANSCFPVNEGPSAHRLNELFLHQFCDAHTCTGRQKPFPKGGKEGNKKGQPSTEADTKK
ncbi:nucleic acid binding protein, putative [Ricinus communis]|uniref:Nucleic acid binding protein, putative n=1 Tax=Ricinus communis TaxID=3988 RepID=B9SLR4_RICCO|nr:nucleic acid binding protein, putative [Ricinus communis]